MFGSNDDQSNGNAMMAPAMPSADQTYAASPDPAATAPAVDPAMSTAPIDDVKPAADPMTPEPAMQPAYSDDTATVQPESTSEPVADVDHQDLMAIKNEALQHLGPMVGSLEQSPEEKFKTLMMMIQASDDHTKLKDAFDIAKQIEDDKARAQALLDVINEINYFTQPPTE